MHCTLFFTGDTRVLDIGSWVKKRINFSPVLRLSPVLRFSLVLRDVENGCQEPGDQNNLAIAMVFSKDTRKEFTCRNRAAKDASHDFSEKDCPPVEKPCLPW